MAEKREGVERAPAEMLAREGESGARICAGLHIAQRVAAHPWLVNG